MDNATLTAWLDTAFARTAGLYGLAPEDFWPDQGRATSLSWSLVMEAANALYGEDELDLFVEWHGDHHRRQREVLRDQHWLVHGHRHFGTEGFNDLCVLRNRVLVFTCESETNHDHGVGGDGGYAHDFRTLLMVPSPHRLFVGRVGGGPDRRATLRQTLVDLYAASQLPPTDLLGIVLLTAEYGKDRWRDTSLWTRASGAWTHPWPKNQQ